MRSLFLCAVAAGDGIFLGIPQLRLPNVKIILGIEPIHTTPALAFPILCHRISGHYCLQDPAPPVPVLHGIAQCAAHFQCPPLAGHVSAVGVLTPGAASTQVHYDVLCQLGPGSSVILRSVSCYYDIAVDATSCHKCHKHAYCTNEYTNNTTRSLECICGDGYTGDGINCVADPCRNCGQYGDSSLSQCGSKLVPQPAVPINGCACYAAGVWVPCADVCYFRCHANANCASVPTAGSDVGEKKCICNNGFTGNGLMCEEDPSVAPPAPAPAPPPPVATTTYPPVAPDTTVASGGADPVDPVDAQCSCGAGFECLASAGAACPDGDLTCLCKQGGVGVDPCKCNAPAGGAGGVGSVSVAKEADSARRLGLIIGITSAVVLLACCCILCCTMRGKKRKAGTKAEESGASMRQSKSGWSLTKSGRSRNASMAGNKNSSLAKRSSVSGSRNGHFAPAKGNNASRSSVQGSKAARSSLFGKASRSSSVQGSKAGRSSLFGSKTNRSASVQGSKAGRSSSTQGSRAMLPLAPRNSAGPAHRSSMSGPSPSPYNGNRTSRASMGSHSGSRRSSSVGFSHAQRSSTGPARRSSSVGFSHAGPSNSGMRRSSMTSPHASRGRSSVSQWQVSSAHGVGKSRSRTAGTSFARRMK